MVMTTTTEVLAKRRRRGPQRSSAPWRRNKALMARRRSGHGGNVCVRVCESVWVSGCVCVCVRGHETPDERQGTRKRGVHRGGVLWLGLARYYIIRLQVLAASELMNEREQVRRAEAVCWLSKRRRRRRRRGREGRARVCAVTTRTRTVKGNGVWVRAWASGGIPAGDLPRIRQVRTSATLGRRLARRAHVQPGDPPPRPATRRVHYELHRLDGLDGRAASGRTPRPTLLVVLESLTRATSPPSCRCRDHQEADVSAAAGVAARRH